MPPPAFWQVPTEWSRKNALRAQYTGILQYNATINWGTGGSSNVLRFGLYINGAQATFSANRAVTSNAPQTFSDSQTVAINAGDLIAFNVWATSSTGGNPSGTTTIYDDAGNGDTCISLMNKLIQN